MLQCVILRFEQPDGSRQNTQPTTRTREFKRIALGSTILGL